MYYKLGQACVRIWGSFFYHKLGQTLQQIEGISLLQIGANVVTNWGAITNKGDRYTAITR